MGYDAFISYSHAADGRLAPAIQDGLQRLAKPWHKRRALRVFRDETGLAVNPHLWESIVEALDSSNWFIVLASPEAAASVWVNREIEHFLSGGNDARARLLPIVTDGVWAWDESINGFTDETNCVPPALADAFVSEPRHLDLSWARSEDQLDLRRAEFRSAIADIAAPIHGMPKDELESEDIRIFRRNRRLRRGAVSGLVVLAAGLGLASCAALGFARSARTERDEADRQARLAQQARTTAEDEAERALVAEGRAQDAAELAEEEAERARLAELVAQAEADRAQEAEAEAQAEAERARLAEQEALDAKDATEAALEEVIRERDRADENERQAVANAEEAAANAATARANAEEAAANAATAEANAEEAAANAATARDNEATAVANALTASSLALAADARGVVDDNPALAALLAVEAMFPDGKADEQATLEARTALGVANRALLSEPIAFTGSTEVGRRASATTIEDGEAASVFPDLVTTERLGEFELLVRSDGADPVVLTVPPTDVCELAGGGLLVDRLDRRVVAIQSSFWSGQDENGCFAVGPSKSAKRIVVWDTTRPTEPTTLDFDENNAVAWWTNADQLAGVTTGGLAWTMSDQAKEPRIDHASWVPGLDTLFRDDPIVAVNPDRQRFLVGAADGAVYLDTITESDGGQKIRGGLGGTSAVEWLDTRRFTIETQSSVSNYELRPPGLDRLLTPWASHDTNALPRLPNGDRLELAFDTFEVMPDGSTETRHHLRRIDTTGVTVWSVDIEDVVRDDSLVLDPRGEHVAIGREGGVAIVEVDTGLARRIETVGAPSGTFAWSSDARLAIAVVDRNQLEVIDIESGTTRSLPVTLTADEIVAIALDRTGQRVIGFGGSGARTGAPIRFLSPAHNGIWRLSDGQLLAAIAPLPLTPIEVDVDERTGSFEIFGPGTNGGDYRLALPDDDPLLACSLAVAEAGDALSALLGRPSICGTVAELVD